MKVRIAYYRGMFLSTIEDYAIKVNGEAIPREDIGFSVGGHTFTLDEMHK
jgi:hypothetical protein